MSYCNKRACGTQVWRLTNVKRVVSASANENDAAPSPFCSRATTGVDCMRLENRGIGMETNLDCCDLAEQRPLEQAWH